MYMMQSLSWTWTSTQAQDKFLTYMEAKVVERCRDADTVLSSFGGPRSAICHIPARSSAKLGSFGKQLPEVIKQIILWSELLIAPQGNSALLPQSWVVIIQP